MKPGSIGAIMTSIKQFDAFVLCKDLNPEITKGMKGVILDILGRDSFIVEFPTSDGNNYGYQDDYTFTVDSSYISIDTTTE